MVIIMKKKLVLRILSGFPIGVTLGYFITIIISFILANGAYYPCVPELISIAGNEINAVLIQAVLCGILGSGFAAASLIWSIDSWGIAKQTGIYFLIISSVMLPVAYLTYWMEHSLKGFLSYFGIFVLIFAATWIIQFLTAKRNIKKINDTLSKNKKA